MARKKKTTSDAKPDSDTEVSKAGAISGAVKDADFDTPDAAMADTSLEEKDAAATDAPAEEVVEAEPAVEDADATDTELKVEPEAETESKSEPVAVAPAPAPEQQSSGFMGMVLGGIIAAIIGFGGAIMFDAAEWPVFGGAVEEAVEDPIPGQLAEQATALEALTAQIEALSAAVSDGQNADVAARAELTARLDALPTTSAELMPEDLRALLSKQKTEMDALQGSLDQMAALAEGQIASAQEQQENAAIAEARAKARGALNAVRTALNSGGAYADVLPEIAGATEVPEVLQANADTGIPTAESLIDGFGPVARTALSASTKATAGDAPADRVMFFLKDQLGARSLTPQEGDSPDAVLSRIEGAVRSGDITAALELIPALPEEGQAVLQDWADKATTRNDALVAFDSLSDALSAN